MQNSVGGEYATDHSVICGTSAGSTYCGDNFCCFCVVMCTLILAHSCHNSTLCVPMSHPSGHIMGLCLTGKRTLSPCRRYASLRKGSVPWLHKRARRAGRFIGGLHNHAVGAAFGVHHPAGWVCSSAHHGRPGDLKLLLMTRWPTPFGTLGGGCM